MKKTTKRILINSKKQRRSYGLGFQPPLPLSLETISFFWSPFPPPPNPHPPPSQLFAGVPFGPLIQLRHDDHGENYNPPPPPDL